MAIKDIIISQFAEDDLDEIAAYYFSLSPDYVEKVISDFEENVMSLKEHPKSGRIVPELEKQGITQYRELIQGYYRIVYEISEETIIVHTIIDGRRNFEELIISKLSRYYGNRDCSNMEYKMYADSEVLNTEISKKKESMAYGIDPNFGLLKIAEPEVEYGKKKE